MAHMSIRDLRDHVDDVIGRVEAGERLIVTRKGRPVAELRPVRVTSIDAAELAQRWRRVPVVDHIRLRRDLDRTVDQSL